MLFLKHRCLVTLNRFTVDLSFYWSDLDNIWHEGGSLGAINTEIMRPRPNAKSVAMVMKKKTKMTIVRLVVTNFIFCDELSHIKVHAKNQPNLPCRF